MDIIKKIECILRIPVHFINECEDRDMAHGADFEKFSCLRLHTL